MRQLFVVLVSVSLLSPFDFLGAQEESTSQSKSWRRIRQQGFFTVSLDPDNLPYSARGGEAQGIEVELAHALAKQLELVAKIDWIHVRSETSLARLLDRECDLVIGLPVERRLRNDDESIAGRIVYTRPYYRTGNLIFVRKDGPRVETLSDLDSEQTRRVGTQAGSLADFMLKQRGFRRQLFGTQQSALQALAANRIDFAYLWSNATWRALNSPELAVENVQPYELVDGHDMAAAVRRGNEGFREQLDGALGRLVEDKFVERLLNQYGMPYYPSRKTTPQANSKR
jgi:ABC-type amino acid transport substrate-binding protein